MQDDDELHEMYTDVISIVKDSVPHIMTIRELEEALDTVVWMEFKDRDENSSCQYRLITAYSMKHGHLCLLAMDGVPEDIEYSQIGIDVRFWNKRPYEEQRKAVPWG